MQMPLIDSQTQTQTQTQRMVRQTRMPKARINAADRHKNNADLRTRGDHKDPLTTQAIADHRTADVSNQVVTVTKIRAKTATTATALTSALQTHLVMINSAVLTGIEKTKPVLRNNKLRQKKPKRPAKPMATVIQTSATHAIETLVALARIIIRPVKSMPMTQTTTIQTSQRKIRQLSRISSR